MLHGNVVQMNCQTGVRLSQTGAKIICFFCSIVRRFRVHRGDRVAETIGMLNPAFHRVIGDRDSELHGFVVIDEFLSGRGTGGIRCTEDVSLDVVARLAREMTLKFAFLRLPSGGAKAGIVVPPGLSAERRRQLFYGFGEAIGDLIREGRYVGGLDMGTSTQDIDAVMAGAGVPRTADSRGSDIDSSYYTALTVLASADALLEARGHELRGATVLLEGVGKVGGHLLRLLDSVGARIVGISTIAGAVYDNSGLNVDKIIQATARVGDGFVVDHPGQSRAPARELFFQEADLLIPGGAPDSINEDNIGRIKARCIVPVANICANPDLETALHDRGIDFIPGFVSNSGGVFCWYLSRLSSEARDEMIREEFKSRIKRLIRMADNSITPIASSARRVAQENLTAMKRVEDGDVLPRLTALAKKLSPKRLGYVIGVRVFGSEWSRQFNVLTRSYFTSRYFH